jgi:hypothetical protein
VFHTSVCVHLPRGDFYRDGGASALAG